MFGLSEGSVIKLRHPKGKILVAISERQSSAETHEEQSIANTVGLRAGGPFDNRFLFVDEDKGCLCLKMGHVDPRTEGIGLFSKTETFCKPLMDVVYVYTNVKYGKVIWVKVGSTPSLALLNPTETPACAYDTRMFLKCKTRGDSFLLQPVDHRKLDTQDRAGKNEDEVMLAVTYNEAGEVTLSPHGSLLVETNGIAQ